MVVLLVPAAYLMYILLVFNVVVPKLVSLLYSNITVPNYVECRNAHVCNGSAICRYL